MPIYKYNSFEEAERALWNFLPNEAYFHRVAELWEFANKLAPMSYPKGIFRYRNIEEANRQSNEWELAHAKKVNTQRRGVIL